MKYNYLTEEEAKMPADMVDMQITLGLKACTNIKEVRVLLQDIRTHERHLVYHDAGIVNGKAAKRLIDEIDNPKPISNSHKKFLEECLELVKKFKNENT